MKRSWLGLVVMLLAPGVSAAADGDDFDDFRIPEHRRVDWSGDLRLDGFRSSDGTPNVESRTRELRGLLESGYTWLHDSDPSRTSVRAFGSVEPFGDWSSEADRFPGVADDHRDSGFRDIREDWGVVFEQRLYPWALPIGFSLASTAAGTTEQLWDKVHSNTRRTFGGVEQRQITSTTSERWLYAYAIATNLSVGVGRVRDATGVYEAWMLEERLRHSGALVRPLSKEARRKLTALMTVRSAYESFRDRPVKSLWSKVEAILEDDGALGERGLDAESILRVGEPTARPGIDFDVLPSSPFARNVGWFVGPAASDRHTQFLVREDVSNAGSLYQADTLVFGPFANHAHAESQQHSDEVFAGAQAEVHRPMGLRWQGDLSSRALFPVQAHHDGVVVSTLGSLSWMLADSWLASAFVREDRTLLQRSGSTIQDDWRWNYGVAASWYLEDRLQLGLSIGENQYHSSRPVFFGPSGRSLRFGSVSLALGYRFLGAFEAPGLIPRETLAVPR